VGFRAAGQTEETFASPGIVIFDSRGYVATPQVSGFGSTVLRVFDVSDPVTPTEIPQDSPRLYGGTPVALVGDPQSSVTGGPILALGTARTQIPWGPSNLYLFDASTEIPQWIGAVTVGTSPTDGILQQVVLKGERAYVATAGIGKGIQVIDVATARDLMAAKLQGQYEWSPAFMEMLGGLNTEGAGFGQAATIQTVFVDTGTQQNSQLYALDVYDGLADGVSQPIVVATGRTPLAIVNPQSGQVLFNGPIPWPGHDAVTSWGTAIAVAHMADRDVAVLLTQGLPSPNLVTIDLANPRAPQVLGVVALTGSDAGWKTGLLIKDAIAYVGGETNTMLVNLTDPVRPRLAGTITGVGGRLSLSTEGVLLGTNHPFAGSPEGVRTATLARVAYIPRPVPTITRPVPASTQPPGEPPAEDASHGPSIVGEHQPLVEPASLFEETLSDIPIAAMVLPPDPGVTQGTLELFHNGNRAYSVPMALVNGRGVFVLPKGALRPTDALTTVNFAALLSDSSVLTAAPQRVDMGRIELRVDSNNDTIVAPPNTAFDDFDRAAAADPQQAFAFWQADSKLSDEDQFVDWATVSVRLADPGTALRNRVGLRIRNGIWRLIKKITEPGKVPPQPVPSGCRESGKLALCHQPTAQSQAGVEAQTGFFGEMILQEDGGIVIPAHLLRGVANDFLFRCVDCTAKTMEVGRIANGAFEPLVGAAIDIRPISRWMSVKRARPDKDTEEVRSDGLTPVPGWAEDLASAALSGISRVTVLVHGFNVSEDEATSSTFPMLFKRLYWTKHPVLSRQYAHTVGVAWPGGVLPGALDFPRQEMHAFKTGALLADYLTSLKNRAGAPTVSILAHSLGNLAAQTAIRYAQGITESDSLAMVEAAVTRESFFRDDQAIPPDESEDILRTGGLLGASVTQYGYPNDSVWEGLWDNQPPENAYLVHSAWVSALGTCAPTDAAVSRYLYTHRWRRVAQSTPWRGIFAMNTQGIRLFNVFNREDQALKLDWNGLWWRGQVVEKPNTIADTYGLFWATLRDLTAFDTQTWISDALTSSRPLDANSPLNATQKARRNRRWAELAYYFRALARPAGLGPLEAIGSDRNFDATASVGSGGFPSYKSHTYITAHAFTRVWPVFIWLTETALK